VRRVVPRVLELFRRHGVHATWATVGMLFCSSDAELRRYLPDRLPTYADPSQSPYSDLARTGRDESEDPFHFAPSLIEAIRSVPNQEIGSHTFSHYYCLENGQDGEAFRSDLAAALQVARAHGVTCAAWYFRATRSTRHISICAARQALSRTGARNRIGCISRGRSNARRAPGAWLGSWIVTPTFPETTGIRSRRRLPSGR